MNDELERRLTALGQQPVAPLPSARVDAIEDALLAAAAPRRTPARTAWFAAAAAAILVVAAVAYGLQRGTDRSLEPAAPASTAPDVLATIAPPSTTSTTPATTLAPASTEPLATGTSTSAELPTSLPTSAGPGPTATPTTTPPAPPPTTVAPTTLPSTTLPPGQPVPPASFTVTVHRVGARLVFNWPSQAATGGTRYLLVRVTPAGLLHWPVAEARVARIIPDINATRTVIEKADASAASWVLVVLDADRQLLAVSGVVTSF